MRTLVLDIESDGLRLDAQVIQVACVATELDLDAGVLFRELGRWERKLTFDPKLAEAGALEINGWSEERWKDAVHPREACARLAAFMEPHRDVECVSRKGKPYRVARLAGHNVDFDLDRLMPTFKSLGVFFPGHPRALCTKQLAMWADIVTGAPPPKSYSLVDLCAHYGIAREGEAHDALSDALAAAELARRIVGPLAGKVRQRREVVFSVDSCKASTET